MERFDLFACLDGYQLVCIEGKYNRCICERVAGIEARLPVRDRFIAWLEPL
jgi:hypothetical protein